MSELLGQSGNALPGVRPPGLGLTDLRDGMTFNAVGETVGLVISTAKKQTKSMWLTGHPSITCVGCKLRITAPPNNR
ncbi:MULTISPECIES: hypothetical protein [Bradyrhizobium]|uniref:Uncharacterized protein n=2 Tax=Bradyrhizobium TaxID=374 RepID=A0ABY0Q6U1_9BRAD|nr:MULTISPECIES: hypothetical protein [Bradyrhizobium]SDJ58289.1 hypothetical protein SAMN05444163_5829 [Bradyrhizobium ottawaense]SEC40492.1 hypothetical protein SAMN05444171_1327 [Bradyrhizobium lablabi]